MPSITTNASKTKPNEAVSKRKAKQTKQSDQPTKRRRKDPASEGAKKPKPTEKALPVCVVREGDNPTPINLQNQKPDQKKAKAKRRLENQQSGKLDHTKICKAIIENLSQDVLQSVKEHQKSQKRRRKNPKDPKNRRRMPGEYGIWSEPEPEQIHRKSGMMKIQAAITTFFKNLTHKDTHKDPTIPNINLQPSSQNQDRSLAVLPSRPLPTTHRPRIRRTIPKLGKNHPPPNNPSQRSITSFFKGSSLFSPHTDGRGIPGVSSESHRDQDNLQDR